MGLRLDISEETLKDWIHVILGGIVAAALRPLGKAVKNLFTFYMENKNKPLSIKTGHAMLLTALLFSVIGIIIGTFIYKLI